jgi:hypothetical protein
LRCISTARTPCGVEQTRCAAGWLHSLSSHRPCDTFWAPTPPHPLLSRKNISRKKDLYGKTKKSTHGHQKLIRSRTQPRGMPVARPRRRHHQQLAAARPRRLFQFQGNCRPPPHHDASRCTTMHADALVARGPHGLQSTFFRLCMTMHAGARRCTRLPGVAVHFQGSWNPSPG